MLQAAAGADALELETLGLEESKGIAVDPAKCALGQYSVAVKLTAASIPAKESCANADGSVTPYTELRMGSRTVRSKTLASNFPAYLETFQFGCQDTATPVLARVVNAGNGKTCFRASLMDWAKGRRAVYTEAQEPDSPGGGFSLVKDTMQSFSFSMQQAAPSQASVDLSILAYPGPMAAAKAWEVHSSGDIAGIVVGMLAFLGLVVAFVHRIRQGSGPSVGGDPGDVIVDATAAAAAAAAAAAGGKEAAAPGVNGAAAESPKKTRQQGKLGVEVLGADSA
jgi:hypothetical protein